METPQASPVPGTPSLAGKRVLIGVTKSNWGRRAGVRGDGREGRPRRGRPGNRHGGQRFRHGRKRLRNAFHRPCRAWHPDHFPFLHRARLRHLSDGARSRSSWQSSGARSRTCCTSTARDGRARLPCGPARRGEAHHLHRARLAVPRAAPALVESPRVAGSWPIVVFSSKIIAVSDYDLRTAPVIFLRDSSRRSITASSHSRSRAGKKRAPSSTRATMTFRHTRSGYS